MTACCSTSARPSLSRSCSADVFRAPKARPGRSRLSHNASRAMSQGFDGEISGDSLHSELQRAVSEYKAQQEASTHAASSSGRPSTSSWDFDSTAADLTVPWPSNLPTDQTGEANAAPRPLEFYPTSQHFELNWGVVEEGIGTSAPPDNSSHIYVILFGVGEGETEGIYTLRAFAKENGLPVDTVVAFECATDAERYACLLEASMVHKPTVLPYEWGEMLDFCNESGYRLRLELSGSLMIPPDYNVGVTDWEKSVRLRNGEFQVLASEPEPAEALASPFAGLQQQLPQPQQQPQPLGSPFASASPAAEPSPFSSASRDAFGLETADWTLGPPTWALDACLEEEGTEAGSQQSQQQQPQLPAWEEQQPALGNGISSVDSQLSDPAQLAQLKAQLEGLLPRDA